MKSVLNRRQFFKGALGVVAGLGASHSVLGQAMDNMCDLTARQPEGPFYPVENQPDKDNDLTQVRGKKDKAKGQILYVFGHILNENCEPISGALVEIWQAAESGKYNHPSDPNPAPLDPHFQYWGKDVSDESGKYSFKTIIPGNYPAGDGWIRPSHLHYKVQKRGFFELITQLYFEGNPYNEKDRILKSLSPQERESVIVKLIPPLDWMEKDAKQCIFNVTLRGVPR